MLETIHCGNIVCMLVCTNLPLFLSPNLLMQGRIWILNSKLQRTLPFLMLFALSLNRKNGCCVLSLHIIFRYVCLFSHEKFR